MKIYLVGGAVRDQLLNIPVTEKDWVVVGATPEEMMTLGYRPIGKDFPVFLHPVTHEEYALARTERKTGRGYTGFHFYASPDVSLEDDLKRRDLTINAMVMDIDNINKNTLIDPYDGQGDIKRKVLKHVSLAFREDPVRILRTARFLARYFYLGFSIDKTTMDLMSDMVKTGESDFLVPDRVWQECDKALGEKNPEKFFDVLDECGALEKIFPEFKYFKKNKNITIITHPKKVINFVRFILALKLDFNTITDLCEKYPVPSYYKELAVLAIQYENYFTQKNNEHLNPESMLDLLEKSDAYRRPDRFMDLLSVFNDSPELDLFKHALDITKNITITDLINQNLKGKVLGEAIHDRRLEVIKTIPHFPGG